jgi:hypothetical protein
LVGEAESAHRAADDFGVGGEDLGDEGVSLGSELGPAGSAVALAHRAADESSLLEFVNQESGAAGGDEDAFLDIAEEKFAFVVEDFEDGELGLGEVVPGDVGFGVGTEGFDGAVEDDPEVEGGLGGGVGGGGHHRRFDFHLIPKILPS